MIRFYNKEVVEKQSVMQEEWWESEEQMEARFFKNEIKKMVRGPFVSIFFGFSVPCILHTDITCPLNSNMNYFWLQEVLLKSFEGWL